MINIWLDDIRPAPEGWLWAKDVGETINMLNKHKNVNILSLDHDLGLLETGYDVLCYLELKVSNDKSWPIPQEIRIHSANPVGRARMEAAIMQIYRMKGETHGN